MWFEILPSAGVIFIALGLPHFSSYFINKFALGNSYRRNLYTPEEQMQYLRDTRVAGNPYKVIGLEAIPDE